MYACRLFWKGTFSCWRCYGHKTCGYVAEERTGTRRRRRVAIVLVLSAVNPAVDERNNILVHGGGGGGGGIKHLLAFTPTYVCHVHHCLSVKLLLLLGGNQSITEINTYLLPAPSKRKLSYEKGNVMHGAKGERELESNTNITNPLLS